MVDLKYLKYAKQRKIKTHGLIGITIGAMDRLRSNHYGRWGLNSCGLSVVGRLGLLRLAMVLK